MFVSLCYNVIFFIFGRVTDKFVSCFVGIPSRKITNTARSSVDARNGLNANATEDEARGSGTPPGLSGNGDETVRLGKWGCRAEKESLCLVLRDRLP